MKKKPTRIEEIVKTIIKNTCDKQEESKENLEEAWEQAAGKTAIAHTTLTAFKKNILTVAVNNSSWMYQLSINKTKIEKIISQRLKKQIQIKLRVGEKQ